MKNSNSTNIGGSLPTSILSDYHTITNSSFNPEVGYPAQKLKNFSNSFSTTMKNLIGQSTAVTAFIFLLLFTVSFTAIGQVSVTPTADLITADDTGNDTADDLTNKTSVSIDVTFASPETSTVLTLNVNGVLDVANTVANSPTGTFTFSAVALNVGANTITIDSKEVAKSTTTSSNLVITVDNTAPVVPSVLTFAANNAVALNISDETYDLQFTGPSDAVSYSYSITSDGGANSITVSDVVNNFSSTPINYP